MLYFESDIFAIFMWVFCWGIVTGMLLFIGWHSLELKIKSRKRKK